MNPEKETAIPPESNSTVTGLDSLVHFLNSSTASSRDTTMYILAERQFGQDTAKAMAVWLNWNVDPLVLAHA